MKRTEVEQKYKWAVEDIFPSDEAWEVAFQALAPKMDFAKYRGTLNTVENLVAYFEAEEALSVEAMRVYLYAFLKHDEDVGNTKYMGYMGKMMGVLTKFSMETSFVTPELTALPEETLRAFAADERLKDYDYMLTRILAEKKYILSEAEERILAQTAEPMSVANDVFGMLDNAELNAPEIEYEGKKQTITNGLYSMIMSGKDRAKREEAFRLFYSAYGKILGRSQRPITAASRRTSSIKTSAGIQAVFKSRSWAKTSTRASIATSSRRSTTRRRSCTAICMFVSASWDTTRCTCTTSILPSWRTPSCVFPMKRRSNSS